ncbi:DNA polymerase [Pantoea brenneri]|uniref:DNA polymerase n=1 Tax=Pantoea brenneri TaxID=472694 RepID=UPI00289A5FDE|nr:DNA polymerase [Pantoea brenneri]
MINQYNILLYLKDFQAKGKDRYFLFKENLLSEVQADELFNLDSHLITHDYTIISESIFKKCHKLPNNVVDIVDFKKFLLQEKITEKNKDSFKIKEIIKDEFQDKNDLIEYFEIFYKKKPFNIDTYLLFAHKISDGYERLLAESLALGEQDRYFNIEIPCYNALCTHLAAGIKINNDKLKEYKNEINYDYFKKIKSFSETFNFMYEMPSNESIKRYVTEKGYSLSEESLDYIIEFIPMPDDFGKKVRELQKINATRNTFLSMPHSRNTIYPSVDVNGSVTSRIYLKSPTIQNISKNYRDIFIADKGCALSYVDYDQFEVGIMAHFSNDEKLIEIYSDADIYLKFSEDVFGTYEKRKIAKRLFLSFTYGMSKENLIKVVEENQGNIRKAREFFSSFKKFDEWRARTVQQFSDEGRVGTLHGNFLKIKNAGDLSNREKRSCISQVIQGTGSLIFKKTIIEISKIKDLKIIIPMHDALLIQHPDDFNAEIIIKIFEDVMSDTLKNERLITKASLGTFI